MTDTGIEVASNNGFTKNISSGSNLQKGAGNMNKTGVTNIYNIGHVYNERDFLKQIAKANTAVNAGSV